MDAARILNYCRSKQIQYDAADNGFVFTTAELDSRMRRRNRLEAARRPENPDTYGGPSDNASSANPPDPAGLKDMEYSFPRAFHQIR